MDLFALGAIEPPNLIELQLNSYVDFLQKELPPSKRKEVGLQAVLREVFPIESYDGKVLLDFAGYQIGDPKLSALKCQREGLTYSAPLHITFTLKDEKGVKEETVYMGEIPLTSYGPIPARAMRISGCAWSGTARPPHEALAIMICRASIMATIESPVRTSTFNFNNPLP